MNVELSIHEACQTSGLVLGPWQASHSLALHNGATKLRLLLPALQKLGTEKHVQGCTANSQTYKPSLFTPVLDMLVTSLPLQKLPPNTCPL